MVLLLNKLLRRLEINIKLEKEDLTIEYDPDDNVCIVKVAGLRSKGYTKEELIKILYNFTNTLENLH